MVSDFIGIHASEFNKIFGNEEWTLIRAGTFIKINIVNHFLPLAYHRISPVIYPKLYHKITVKIQWLEH